VKAWTIISTSDRIEPLNAAERMRLHRKRHRNGLLCVRLLLHETEIDAPRSCRCRCRLLRTRSSRVRRNGGSAGRLRRL
jgi:hypothetical protein